VSQQATKNRTTVTILAIVLILVVVGAFLFFAFGPGRLYPREVSIRQLRENPSLYAGQQVKTVGYLVKHTAPHFGDTYTLCEGDPRNLYFAENPCVAVAGPPATIDLHLSFLYNGTNYEVVLSPCSFAVPCRVLVSGAVTNRGPVTDASQCVIEASSVAWHE